jgi:hypothetical protein
MMSVPTMSLNAIYEACLLQGVFRITGLMVDFTMTNTPLARRKKLLP